MFESIKTALKIRKFRKYNSELVKFYSDKHTVIVKNGKTTIEVSFKLVYFDELYVAFSGDGVCCDADCLARIFELLWNCEFPMNFPKIQIEALTEQVRKVRLLNMIPENGKNKQEEAENKENLTMREKKGLSQAAAVQADEELQKELNKKIYFRDMHNFVMGDPNYVRVTLRLNRTIDR